MQQPKLECNRLSPFPDKQIVLMLPFVNKAPLSVTLIAQCSVGQLIPQYKQINMTNNHLGILNNN